MKFSQNPIARHTGLVIQEMPDEVLVYDMDSNKAHCLNETAAFVWKSCDGKNSVADIVREFETNTGGRVSEDFVWLAIDQLHENGLLDSAAELHFAGQSRREVLKKIGLASIIALPVIASLVAPKSAMAAGSCACINTLGCAAQTGCPSTACCSAAPGGAVCVAAPLCI